MIRRCSTRRCGRTATYRGRCPTHAARADQAIRRAGRSIYSTKRWRMLRRRRLEIDEGTCQRCGRLATDVHHVLAVEDGGEPFDLDNTESLCASCHGRETAAELLRRRQRGKGKVEISSSPVVDTAVQLPASKTP